VRWLIFAVVLGGCHDKYKEMQEQAAASASAAAAASASALAATLAAASANAAPKPPPDRISVQHILVAYKGADKAPKRVSRTKEQARLRAEEARQKALAGGVDFGDLAQLYSDDPSGQERQGIMHDIGRNDVVKEFADVAFALKENEVSAVVETPFGFHVIKRNQ
jgi:parvulin-like peptidyl-prolyl isomerase